MTEFIIILGALIIGDSICYVHGHKLYFYKARTDEEKELLYRIHNNSKGE